MATSNEVEPEGDIEWESEDYYDDELDCTWCNGEGWEDNDDPLWHGFDVEIIPCHACAGTGKREHQTIF